MRRYWFSPAYWRRRRRYGARNLCALCGGVIAHGHHGTTSPAQCSYRP